MNILKTVWLCACILLAAVPVWSAAPDAARCLEAAYPGVVTASGPDAVLVNGQQIALRRAEAQDYETRLNQAGLLDQLEQLYPLDFATPSLNHDPGRMRDAAFFDAMYGRTEGEVRAKLVKVLWLPSGKSVLFTQVNRADQALEAVGREIAQHPELRAYMTRTNGSFNYRVVAGTQRKSPHSYGIAIDFALPRDLGMYWRWSGCRPGATCPYPPRLLQDQTLRRIVGIFEKHGFIWGGKWYHFDSVHFEYRPELLLDQCRVAGPLPDSDKTGEEVPETASLPLKPENAVPKPRPDFEPKPDPEPDDDPDPIWEPVPGRSTVQ